MWQKKQTFYDNIWLVQLRLTGHKEHDPSSKWAVEPLKGWEVGKGEDARNDAGKAWHGREDHESTGGIPVGWGGVGQEKENTVRICAGRGITKLQTFQFQSADGFKIMMGMNLPPTLTPYTGTHVSLHNVLHFQISVDRTIRFYMLPSLSSLPHRIPNWVAWTLVIEPTWEYCTVYLFLYSKDIAK